MELVKVFSHRLEERVKNKDSKSEPDQGRNPRKDYDPVALAMDGVDSFYEEVDDYYGSLNYFTNEPKDKRDESRRIYHFSSVVWKDTSKLGIGIAKFSGYPAQSAKYN